AVLRVDALEPEAGLVQRHALGRAGPAVWQHHLFGARALDPGEVDHRSESTLSAHEPAAHAPAHARAAGVDRDVAARLPAVVGEGLVVTQALDEDHQRVLAAGRVLRVRE